MVSQVSLVCPNNPRALRGPLRDGGGEYTIAPKIKLDSSRSVVEVVRVYRGRTQIHEMAVHRAIAVHVQVQQSPDYRITGVITKSVYATGIAKSDRKTDTHHLVDTA